MDTPIVSSLKNYMKASKPLSKERSPLKVVNDIQTTLNEVRIQESIVRIESND